MALTKCFEAQVEWCKTEGEEQRKFATKSGMKPEAIERMFSPPEKDKFLPEYQAVLAILRKFEAMGYDSRLVFWFDN